MAVVKVAGRQVLATGSVVLDLNETSVDLDFGQGVEFRVRLVSADRQIGVEDGPNGPVVNIPLRRMMETAEWAATFDYRGGEARLAIAAQGLSPDHASGAHIVTYTLSQV